MARRWVGRCVDAVLVLWVDACVGCSWRSREVVLSCIRYNLSSGMRLQNCFISTQVEDVRGLLSHTGVICSKSIREIDGPSGYTPQHGMPIVFYLTS